VEEEHALFHRIKVQLSRFSLSKLFIWDKVYVYVHRGRGECPYIYMSIYICIVFLKKSSIKIMLLILHQFILNLVMTDKKRSRENIC
jgi:hypothetical protein